MEGGHIVKKFSRSLSFQLMMFVFLDMLVCTAGALLIFYFGKKIIKQWGLCTGMQSGFPACELLLLFSILLMMLFFIYSIGIQILKPRLKKVAVQQGKTGESWTAHSVRMKGKRRCPISRKYLPRTSARGTVGIFFFSF